MMTVMNPTYFSGGSMSIVAEDRINELEDEVSDLEDTLENNL